MIDPQADNAWLAALPDCEALTVTAGEAALAAAPTLRRIGDEISVLLTDDATVHALNAQFRGKDKPTNVLSFPASDTAYGHLGDIALAYGVCVKEAEEQGKTLAAHLQHLVAHGVLHLLGYDHEDDEEATEMENLERQILAGLGLPDPYAENSPA